MEQFFNEYDRMQKICGDEELEIWLISQCEIAAQEHPEDYHNLVVRIAGYSAYFVDMTEAMQNDLISRTEHNF